MRPGGDTTRQICSAHTQLPHPSLAGRDAIRATEVSARHKAEGLRPSLSSPLILHTLRAFFDFADSEINFDGRYSKRVKHHSAMFLQIQYKRLRLASDSLQKYPNVREWVGQTPLAHVAGEEELYSLGPDASALESPRLFSCCSHETKL